ncbi:MerR family transcriptional regulator [Pseudonocardia alni subsp. carboxydivorans]|uniref:MerR family transcriptional regulator n=1 Tax=Pseudonocardia alni subsp. carboxydivorans TaxID=415010 RepID=A0ABU9ADP8_PSEA5|nr:MerR family transcriptional regulator [Pseudonocardia sp. ICBG1034]
MKIGELAERTGVSVRMLRYYEQQGLLTSTRSTGGQRLYSLHEPERVELLRTLFAAGLSSRTIASLLPCVDTPGPQTADEAYATMCRERDRLSAAMATLATARDALDGLIACNSEHRAALASPRRTA